MSNRASARPEDNQPANNHEEKWTGKSVMISKTGVKLRDINADRKSPNLAELKRGAILTVEEDQGGLLKVHEAGIAGWFDKADAVLLGHDTNYFTERLRANSNDAEAFACRAVLWKRKGELDIAMKDFSAALQLDANVSMWWLYRGELWMRQRKIKDHKDKAIADFDEAIRVDSNNADAYWWRGKARVQLDDPQPDWEKATEDFSEAIRLDPKHHRAFLSRGKIWFRTRKYDKAMDDYNEALRISPNRYSASSAYQSRAELWLARKDYGKAIEDYREAIRQYPEDSFGYAQSNLAWLLATCPDERYRDGRYAIQLAKVALEKSPWKSGPDLHVLAAAYAEAGQFDEAVATEIKALEDPDDYPRKAEFRECLELYRQKKAYRQPR